MQPRKPRWVNWGKRGDQGTSLGSWNQSSSSLAWKGSLGVGSVTAVPRLPGTAAGGGTQRHSWGRGHTKHGVLGQHAEVRNYRKIQLKTNSNLKPAGLNSHQMLKFAHQPQQYPISYHLPHITLPHPHSRWYRWHREPSPASKQTQQNNSSEENTKLGCL